MATLTYDWQNIANWTVYRANGSVTFWVDAKINRQDINGNYSVIDTRLNSTVVNPISGSGYNFRLTGSGGRSGSGVWTFANETILTGQYTDYHNQDGSKSTYIEAYVCNSYWNIENTFGAWVDSPTIPRAAKITDAINFNDEENAVVTFTNTANFQITPSLKFYTDNTLIKTISREKGSYTSPYTLELTIAEREELRTLLTAHSKCNVKYRLDTYNGDTSVGYNESSNKEFSIVNANPIFTDFTFQDVNQTTLNLTNDANTIVKGYSNIKAIVSTSNKAIAQKHATISKYRFSNGSQFVDFDYFDNSETSGTINNVETNFNHVFAIDSRNNSTLVTKTSASYKEYTPIYVDKQSSSIGRNNGSVGGGAILTLSGTIWNDSFGSVTNSIKSVTYRLKKTDSSDWVYFITNDTNYLENKNYYSYNNDQYVLLIDGTDYNIGDVIVGTIYQDIGTTTIIPTISGNQFSFTGLIASNNEDTLWDLDSAYNIEVTISDKLSSTQISLVLNSAIPTMSIDKEGVGILCAYDRELGGMLQVKGERIDGYNVETDGAPVKTGRRIDDKDEYVKRITCSNLGGSGQDRDYPTGIDVVNSIVTDMKIFGHSSLHNWFPLPNNDNADSKIALMSNGSLRITFFNNNWQGETAYAEIYYI